MPVASQQQITDPKIFIAVVPRNVFFGSNQSVAKTLSMSVKTRYSAQIAEHCYAEYYKEALLSVAMRHQSIFWDLS
jgi:hypothetical protein